MAPVKPLYGMLLTLGGAILVSLLSLVVLSHMYNFKIVIYVALASIVSTSGTEQEQVNLMKGW